MGQTISSAAVRFDRRGQKRWLNASTQTDARTFFVRGRPISGPFSSRICVDVRTRDGRACARSLSSPGSSVGGTLASPYPTATLALLLHRRRRRTFLLVTLPAAGASTSAQLRRPLSRRPPRSFFTIFFATPTIHPLMTRRRY